MLEAPQEGAGRVKAFAAVAATAIVVGVVAFVLLPRPTGSSGPRSASPIVGAFVEQIDGQFGYRMLRPATWMAVDPGSGVGRGYRDTNAPAQARVGLVVYNLAVAARTAVDNQGTIAQWEAFRRDSSLEGWTAGTERTWASIGVKFTLLERLPNAKIYLTQTGASRALVADIIDQGEPLIVWLGGTAAQPSLETLDQLRADGLLADFMTMAKSVRAVPADPTNVSPPLD